MSDANRDRVIAMTVRAGMTREQACITFDVSKHACDQACEAIVRVVGTAPPELQATIMASAFASVATTFRQRWPKQWEAMVAAELQGRGESKAIVMPPPEEDAP